MIVDRGMDPDYWTSPSTSQTETMGPYKEDDAYFFQPETPIDEMAEEYSSNMFQNLIFGAIFGVMLLLFLSLCWNRCANDDTDQDTSHSNKQEMVIAQEIKPGMIVIQGGTKDEQMRIIQEYESLRLQQHQHHQQQQSSSHAQFNYGTTRQVHLQQPPPLHLHPGGASASASAADPFHLIDFDPNDVPRPPPYAPRQ